LTSLDRLFYALSIAGILSLGFIAGSLSAHFNWPTDRVISEAIEAVNALDKKRKSGNRAAKEAGEITVKESRAVTKPGAYQGYTLYTPKMESRAILVDMNGKEVYSWHKPFSEVWPDLSHLKNPMPDSNVYFDDAYLYPNGDLLAIYAGSGDTPYGYGLAKLDKNSNVVWRFDKRVHHRLDVTPDGHIYILTQEMANVSKDPDLKFAEGKIARIIKEWLVILSPDARVIKQVSLSRAFLDSPYAKLLFDKMNNNPPAKRWDFLHSNSVDVLTPEMAKHFPMFKAGQVLISFRELHALAVLDVESEKIIWLAQGEWKLQHDAEFVSDGSIMLFDNRGKSPRASRILKYNHQTKISTVAYEGNAANPFATRIRGMQQQLANGNLLITESQRGRIFEVLPTREIVWDFIIPYHLKNKPLNVVIAKRYSPEELTFLKQ